MTRLPSLRPRKVISVLNKIGFTEYRQRGSHKIFIKGEHQIIVPMHSKSIKRGTLRQIIKCTGLTRDEFLKYLKKY